MVTINKHGLSREIDSATKRQVRKNCGYGCVICGGAIYQYEHIDPPFSEARDHNLENIALLCGGCHGPVTSGIWSKEKVIRALAHPKTKEQGFSNFALDVGADTDFTVRVGNTSFKNLEKIIQIDGVDILSIKRPEARNSSPLISARFFGRDGEQIAQIVENEWRGATDAFDIETIGRTITIRCAERRIDLRVSVNPPTELVIDQLCLHYEGKTIQGSLSRGFEVISNKSSVSIPSDPKPIEKAPYWLSISNDGISLGTDEVMTFISAAGEKGVLPGTYEIRNASLQFVDPAEVGGVPVPGREGEKVLRITANADNATIMFRPNEQTTVAEQARTKKGTSTVPYHRHQAKIGRNEPCWCGSGMKYKKCHGQVA